MIFFNIPVDNSKFNSYSAYIEYLGSGKVLHTVVEGLDIVEFEKSIKKEIRIHKSAFSVKVIVKEWKSEESYKEFTRLPYNHPITGELVWPNKSENVWESSNTFEYSIANNKAKLILSEKNIERLAEKINKKFGTK